MPECCPSCGPMAAVLGSRLLPYCRRRVAHDEAPFVAWTRAETGRAPTMPTTRDPASNSCKALLMAPARCRFCVPPLRRRDRLLIKGYSGPKGRPAAPAGGRSWSAPCHANCRIRGLIRHGRNYRVQWIATPDLDQRRILRSQRQTLLNPADSSVHQCRALFSAGSCPVSGGAPP